MPLLLKGVGEGWQGIPPTPAGVIKDIDEPLWVSGKRGWRGELL